MQQILLQHWIPSCILEENGLPMVSLKSGKRVSRIVLILHINDLVIYLSRESHSYCDLRSSLV